MAIPRELEALVEERYFEKVAQGDQRAAGLFTRLAAYALNPTGDPRGWGCLRKTGGGHNVEGYSEDAIVYGNDPNDFHNVRDIIGGAGAPGARLNWGDGFVNRRASDIWEKPVALNAEQLAYLKGSAAPQPNPNPQPNPSPVPIDLSPLFAVIADLGQQLDILQDDLDHIGRQVMEGRAEAERARRAIENLAERVDQGLTLTDVQATLKARFVGTVTVPVSGKVRG